MGFSARTELGLGDILTVRVILSTEECFLTFTTRAGTETQSPVPGCIFQQLLMIYSNQKINVQYVLYHQGDPYKSARRLGDLRPQITLCVPTMIIAQISPPFSGGANQNYSCIVLLMVTFVVLSYILRVYLSMCTYLCAPEQVFSGDKESQVVGQPFLHESQTQPSSGPA